MAEIVYLNGSLVPRSQAKISVFDHGFLYGYGLYETMRAYHGKIFLLERHLNRLLESAETIGLGSQLAGIDIGKACSETLVQMAWRTPACALPFPAARRRRTPGGRLAVRPTWWSPPDLIRLSRPTNTAGVFKPG